MEHEIYQRETLNVSCLTEIHYEDREIAQNRNKASFK